MRLPPARRMALEILRRTLDNHQDLQSAANDVLALCPDGPDKGLATELAYGYLRLRGRIDFLLNQLFKRPAQTSPVVRRIVGLAAYELIFLDRIPEYASLDWAVSLVRARCDQTMGRVANGVLRNLLRLGRAVIQPDYYQYKTHDQVQFWSAWYSCPRWLVSLWLKHYGHDRARQFLEASIRAPRIGLRIHAGRPKAQAVLAELEPLTLERAGWGLAVREWSELAEQAVRQGLASRQSLAAQKIMDALGVSRWPEPIWDACAGRGGKALLMAEQGKQVWASDVSLFRLRQIQAEAQRLGCAVPVFLAQAQGLAPLRSAPRTIVLDVPCSGLGVLSRRPDTKWKRTAADCAQLAGLQKQILETAASVLPAGGALVYITCTMTRQENEDQIASFVQAYPQFRLLREIQPSLHEEDGEFFYGAILHKTTSPGSTLAGTIAHFREDNV